MHRGRAVHVAVAFGDVYIVDGYLRFGIGAVALLPRVLCGYCNGGVSVAVVYPDASKFPEGAGKDQMYASIYASIVALNKTLPTYKHIHNVEIRDTEFEKTTSRKIKRHLVK